jgi:hypothetical protein
MILMASLVLLMSVTAVAVFGEGGKVRGAKGEGSVVQVQVRDSDECSPPAFPTR